MDSEFIINVENLAKHYQTFNKAEGLVGSLKSFIKRDGITVKAVDKINFKIKAGEFVGLLGPNGAGKTTTLKMMTGLIVPTSGKVTVFDRFNPANRDRDYLRQIGMVMGQRNQLHQDLPATESFRLAQAIYDISEVDFVERLKRFAGLFDIESKLNVPVRKLSLGERMKLELILAIIHNPSILYLDEPTIGLDFNAAKHIRNFLRELNQNFGVTIILTSHYTKDIEELCERVVLINRGNLIYDGRLLDMSPEFQDDRSVEFYFKDLFSFRQFLKLKSPDNILFKDIQTSEPDLSGTIRSIPHHVAEIISAVLNKISPDNILEIKIKERALDEVFSAVYDSAATIATP